MIHGFLIPFITIALAEFMDKSQLSILLLASKTKHHGKLLLGVLCAFILVDGIAIVLGSWISTLLPVGIVKLISALAFIAFGIFSLRPEKEEKGEEKISSRVFLSGFLLVFLAEWGDKTQIASALFATQYNPFVVFLGVISALLLLSLGAILLGTAIARKIDKKLIKTISGILFIVTGVIFLLF